MKQRCSNPNATRFDRYGRRGISFCERWAKFKNFLDDMGLRPEGKSLERIDNNKGYEPGNCRWATPKEQSSNCERNRWVHVDGRRINLLDASKIVGKNWSSLHHALTKRGLVIVNGHFLIPEWTEDNKYREYEIDR